MDKEPVLKLRSDIFESDYFKTLEGHENSDLYISIWIRMLFLSEKLGCRNFVHENNVPYSDIDFSKEFNKPLSVIFRALWEFEKIGMIIKENGIVKIPENVLNKFIDR